ncbi:MAG: hypothetical protein CMJ54_00210 [Planctomycetaceae bacterium]|nr:hypothetical protein [Planctomycetaceae bacterium]
MAGFVPWPVNGHRFRSRAGFHPGTGRITSESDIPSTNHHPSWHKDGKAVETATIVRPLVPVSTAFGDPRTEPTDSILVGHRPVPTLPPGIRS